MANPTRDAAGRAVSRILVVTLDTLADRMAGPAIRAWEMSTALSAEHEVRLITFGKCDRHCDAFLSEQVAVSGFREKVNGADVVILQGFVAASFPWLQTCPQVIVVDLYDPFHLESLEVERYAAPDRRAAALGSALAELQAQIARGDFFICASEKQRDLWLGHLAAAGRINPRTYDADPSLRNLITVVPFGTSDVAPERRASAIKGVVPRISVDDKVVLWGGGVYNWFDPLTVILAIDQVRLTVPNVRLYFLGMKHPNPDVPEMAMALRARELSDRLGLTGYFVFFNEDWVPYERRSDYLLDSDVGVSAHFDHIETAFSFRTRILDYIWASLPIVSTSGDTFGDLVEAEGLGVAVPPNDVASMRAALELMLLDDVKRHGVHGNVRRLASRFTWSAALEPLLSFCANPHRAEDANWPKYPGVRNEQPARLRTSRRTIRKLVLSLKRNGLRWTARSAFLRLLESVR